MKHDLLDASSEATLCSHVGGSCPSVDEPPHTPARMQNYTQDSSNVQESSVIISLTDEKAHLDSHDNITEGTLPEEEENLSAWAWIKNRVRRSCTRKVLRKRIPILSWAPQYNASWAISDLLAGITVGLTVIPQAIAYANIAGIPPEYGLYSSFVGCFVYTIFGSCKDSPIGPTAIAAILTRENIHDHGPQFAILLCFVSGCVELLMGFLQLGFLIDFISGPVSVGFTSAAAIIIATSQLKDVLGLQFAGSKFLEVWGQLLEHVGDTRLWDAALGVTCMGVLLALRKLKDVKFGPLEAAEQTAWQRALNKTTWLISTSRNILVVVACAALAFVLKNKGCIPFVLTGHVRSGMPSFQPPPFSAHVENQTFSFLDMCTTLGTGSLILPLLAILENIAICKAFSDGRTLDATQEMIALGLCNIASSFVGSMPITGSLSRGAVNNASGVATQFGGVYTGLLVILALQFLTPYFFFIPKSALAAVIVVAVIFMVEVRVVRPMWKTKKIDLIPAFATFLSCLFIRLELGILIGIGVNVLFLLYASARPTVDVEMVVSASGLEYLLVTPDRSLAFPSVDYVRALVTKAGVKQGASFVPVVIDARHIQGADFTAAKGMKSLIEDFLHRSQPLLFYNLKPSIVEMFQAVKPKELKCCDTEDALNDLLKNYANKISHIQTKAISED